jgi:RNA polymerase primary sigma factor
MYSEETELANQLKKTNLQESLIQEIFLVLNEKEQDIISKRFAILQEKKYTLESIGQEYSITRERVRQIEKNALTKLTRICAKTSFSKLIDITNKVIQDLSYCSTEKNLLKAVTENTGGLFIENNNLIALSQLIQA